MALKDLFRRGRRATSSTPADGDRLILEQLRELGADLNRPRHVVHYLYFPDEAGARGAAETLTASGYDADVRPPSDGIERWATIAETHTLVSEAWLSEMRPRLEAIAHANGGEYDGWEAAAD
jgi:hypothetical protein